jgi:hypothetical protein
MECSICSPCECHDKVRRGHFHHPLQWLESSDNCTLGPSHYHHLWRKRRHQLDKAARNKGELITGANHHTSVWLNMKFPTGVLVTEQTTRNDRDWVELVIHPRE